MSKLAKALTAAAGNAGESLYVEDVFSTYLYTGGLSSPNVIQTNIDLAGEGGLVWTKNRTSATSNQLTDTVSGYRIESDDTAAGEASQSNVLFNSDGHSLSGYSSFFNGGGDNYASWTFRKAEKFFDVVTYTGNGVAGRTVAHNLGSVPAMIIVKSTDGAGQNWRVYHTSLGATSGINLNDAGSSFGFAGWNNTAPTDSVFSVNASGYSVNDSGFNYVAYLFAHDAGGFGDDGSESIIKCGSYTGNGSTDGPTVTLGFEPQWLMIRGTGGGDWQILDNMRGIHSGGTNDARLLANSSAAEYNSLEAVQLQATGFKIDGTTGGAFNGSGSNYIYIAIRRPMKTPESGTEVFDPSFRITGDPTIASGFVTDMGIVASRTGGGTTDYHLIGSRLTGNLGMTTTSTNAEVTRGLEPLKWDYNNGWGGSDTASSFAVWYSFKRATGFFDVVAYTGTGSNTTQSHNLGVAPEMIIVKRRSSIEDWLVYHSATGNQAGTGLNQTNATFTGVPQYWNSTSPTDSVFSLGTHGRVNTSAETYIAYLFATLAGVSKVGSYTGTGSNVDVDCGFSAGARFILIKRTDSTGDWYVWDSVRGIVAGNDPYLLLNSTAAEVTSTDYIDPLASGFTVTSSAPAALNASGGNYIFLAIA